MVPADQANEAEGASVVEIPLNVIGLPTQPQPQPQPQPPARQNPLPSVSLNLRSSVATRK